MSIILVNQIIVEEVIAAEWEQGTVVSVIRGKMILKKGETQGTEINRSDSEDN